MGSSLIGALLTSCLSAHVAICRLKFPGEKILEFFPSTEFNRPNFAMAVYSHIVTERVKAIRELGAHVPVSVGVSHCFLGAVFDFVRVHSYCHDHQMVRRCELFGTLAHSELHAVLPRE